ncbi:hypothetical protein [Paenibacillus eucommiae]|uniref:Uncharacterized protein n=1 Tax=Paenibacillus eucommiae TaxID=1355755 RepID=A0ABS4IRQ5_9BACL|nr:hypothetical protein [Paenibacillus eucommiae]MBP1990247.1 hypothetical protein [Paenibacillus eucommiae]
MPTFITILKGEGKILTKKGFGDHCSGISKKTNTVTFYGKTNGSAAQAKGRVRNETASSNLATSSLVDTTSWTAYTTSFTAPSTYTDVVHIYMEHDNPSIAGGIAYFNEVDVTLN